MSPLAPYLVDDGPGDANLGAKVFFIWGGCCFLCFAFAFFFIPETKGLSLEQIDLLYQNSTPITSARYRRELIANDVHVADVHARGAAGPDVQDEKGSQEKV